MNIYMETFGCTFNQADSQIMAGLLQEGGHKLVNQPEESDAIIINTCYVKHPTEQKVINRIHRMQKDFPDKKLLVAGCMVEIDQDKLQKAAPHAGWIGPHHIQSTTDAVKSILNGEHFRLTGYGYINKVCLPKLRTNPLIHIIQICEGCDSVCSYCCTRFARGNLHSYPIKLLKREAEKAVQEGCVEIQLTAQDTAAYGKDTGESLSSLIHQITSLDGDFRVRVGMMHPKSMKDDVDNIIRAFESEKVYKFLHIPVQSGNDTILADMNRGYTVQDFKEIVAHFRENIPEISISTDIIMGYPTEDDQAFQDTLMLVKDVKPDFLHISKYHHRPGTPASLMEEIDALTMKKRSKELNDVKYSIGLHQNQRMIGSLQKVLITGKGSKGGYVGRTNTYKTVIVKNASRGSFVDAKIVEAKGTYLKGEVIY